MLANGIKLAYGKAKGTYTDLVGLKEVPEFGIEPEKVENTTLADKVKKYEFGIGDAGELEYKFAYDNSSTTSSYRVCVRQRKIRRNSSLNKLTQIKLRFNLKVKYLSNLAAAV